MDATAVLQLENVSKSFSGVKVLKEVSLSLNEGEVLGLVGQNGAGKSTLMNIIGGILPKDSGRIFLNGREYDPTNPLFAKKSGIAFIHQELNLFLNLSIAENMFIEDFPKQGLSRQINFKQMKTVARQYTELLGLEINPETIVETLSMGQRQLVEVAKALIKNSTIIIFDEPTTSLSTKEKENLFKVIRDLKAKKTSIIYISHILEDVFSLCDRIMVLRDGQIMGEDLTANYTKDQVIKMMVGRELNQIYPTIEKEVGNSIFKVRNLNQKNKLKNISLDLKEGEITGLFGLMGAGRTELARAIFGIDEITRGEILFDEKPIKPVTPVNCIRNGIAFITENRRYEGLLMPKSVSDNLICAYLQKIASKIFQVINRQREDHHTKKAIADLNIKVVDKDKQPVKNLSGGNQQKVVLGKWLMLEPKVIILDEPTRGVDVGAKYEIYSIINNMAKNKSTVLFISSEMEELIGLCDRILVMHQGEIVSEYYKNDYDPERMLKAAIGGGN